MFRKLWLQGGVEGGRWKRFREVGGDLEEVSSLEVA